MLDPGDSTHRSEVAKRSRRVFHVGLELIERILELRMPFVDELVQRLEQEGVRLPPPEHHGKSIEQRAIAGDWPCVGEREEKLRVVDLDPLEVVQLANLMTDDQPEVPEWVKERAEKPLVVGPNRAVEQDEHVDVRIQTEVPTSVAAKRRDRHRPRGGWGLRVQALQERVHPPRVAFDGHSSAPSTDGLLAELAARGLEHG